MVKRYLKPESEEYRTNSTWPRSVPSHRHNPSQNRADGEGQVGRMSGVRVHHQLQNTAERSGQKQHQALSGCGQTD